MFVRVFLIALSAIPLACAQSSAQTLTASEIMQRVAENQNREQDARKQFVYDETLHRTMRSKDGTLLREEYRTFAVTPAANGTNKKLVLVTGQYRKSGKYVRFTGPPVPEAGLFNVTFDDEEDNKTRDGVDKDLFPLTTDEQKKYEFELEGERVIQGRAAYRIRFGPLDHKEYGWTGEALVDKEEFQPLSIYSRLSRRLPVAVRTLLGTDVPGLGYSVQYTRVDKDLWFPSSYGTEFAVRALFLLNRTFAESGESKNFRRVQVESQIQFGGDANQRER